jgi:aminocarboxymuconate-semialdehyde decarboxylase
MKIDVHWHYLPEEYVQTIRREDSPWPERAVMADGREWLVAGAFRHPLVPELYRPEAQVAEMDRRGVDVAAVSPAPTLFYYHLDAARVLPLHRLVNDRIAALTAAYPGRFAGLATVPLQAPDLAVAELERAMGELGLRGVEIGTNVAGRNLDEPDFRPFFRRAAELGAFVFVHPMAVLGADRLRRYYLTNLIGNPTDTAVAIASLIFGGVFDDVPTLTCCFAHGGGTFPMLLGRWQHGYHVRPEPNERGARPPREYLPRIYVDSLTHDDAARRLAMETVGADHMLLGSDLPFDMGDPDPVATITRMPGLSPAERDLILGGTAARLLGLAAPQRPAGAPERRA